MINSESPKRHRYTTSTWAHGYDRIPCNILREITDVIPQRVCRMPEIYIGGNILGTQQIHTITKVVKSAWCLSRLHGHCYIYVDEVTGDILTSINDCHINNDDKFDIVWNPNLQAFVKTNSREIGLESRMEREIRTIDTNYTNVYHFLPGIDYSAYENLENPYDEQYLNHQGFHSRLPLINQEVLCAVNLYKEAVNRLYLRLKNGNAMMLQIMGLQNDPKRKETMKDLDDMFETQNRLFGPVGSKIDVNGISLDNFEMILEPFWLNIFRAAGIPKWAMGVEFSNSQYPLEERSIQCTDYWYEHCYPAYLAILRVWADPREIEIIPPSYRDELNTLDIQLRKEDIANRAAVTTRLLAQADGQILANEMQQMVNEQGLSSPSEQSSEPDMTGEGDVKDDEGAVD